VVVVKSIQIDKIYSDILKINIKVKLLKDQILEGREEQVITPAKNYEFVNVGKNIFINKVYTFIRKQTIKYNKLLRN